jgi:hypothetical protein
MRSRRRTLAGALLPATALLLALPGGGIAQDPAITYTEGSAQLLLRGGAPTLESFALVSGVRDPGTLSMTLEYRALDGQATLSIVTPNVAGTHAAAAKPPRAAAIRYADVQGRSGARAACTITWADLTADRVSGSYLCPKERLPKGRKTRYAAAGTFTARVTPTADGAVLDPTLPIYPAGTTLESNGQTLTVEAVTNVPQVCLVGRAKGTPRGDCSPKQLPLEGAFSAVALRACVSDSGDVLRLRERTGYSRSLFSGSPETLVPLNLPASVADPSVVTAALPKVVNQGSCVDGHLVGSAQGPLVVWLPPQGAPAVAWTLDPVAVPPTATAPDSGDNGATASPAAGPQSATYTSGIADVLIDGPVTGAADDLVLTEGSLVVDAAGTTVLHLAFASDGGTLSIVLPGAEGSFAWDPGQGTANQGIGYEVGVARLDAGLSGCQVEVAPTETGGVSGTYLCMPTSGGSATGAFVANP